MNPTDTFKVNGPNVVYELIEGEVVVVNLMKGDYYSLVKVGALVWENIVGGLPRLSIINTITSRYDVETKDAEIAVNDLIKQLEDENLVIADSASQGPSVENVMPAGGSGRMKFEKPVLQKYTDMEDILLLDPIHDVDDSGWPNKPKDN